MSEDGKDHLVAATHLILGPCNFLMLRLPLNWDLQIGRHPTDVDYTVAYDGIRWAQEGLAAGLLVDKKARRAIELTIRTARRTVPTPKLENPQPGTLRMYGHPAEYEIGSMRLGLFKTKPYTVLHVAYRCEETKRLVDLRFMHKGDPARLLDLLGPLAGSRCH